MKRYIDGMVSDIKDLFDEQEIEAAMNSGVEPVTLGRRILRTETAGLTMLSILMFEFEGE